jgi:phosphatidylserine decarboxylase
VRQAFGYIDRRSGEHRKDPIYRYGLLDWMYNSRAGWFLTRFVLSRRFVSWLYGWANRRPASARHIPEFVRTMGIDMDESLRPVESFTSLHDLVGRQIDLSRRPLHPDSRVCVAPADGRVRGYQSIHAGTCFELKGCSFSLESFLRDAAAARQYDGGAMVISRLYLSDYHHFHFPADGVAQATRSIRGRYYATTPYARGRAVPFFTENHRQSTMLDSDYFGRIAMVEVGAFVFGSIRQQFSAGARVKRGEAKGMFELGASVVVLLFEAGTIRLDADLCAATRDNWETYVRLGESIGRAA